MKKRYPRSVWRAAPKKGCKGETWRAYAEKLERERFETRTALAHLRAFFDEYTSPKPRSDYMVLIPADRFAGARQTVTTYGAYEKPL